METSFVSMLAEEKERLLEPDDSTDIQVSADGRITRSDVVSYENALKNIGYGKFHVLLLALCGWAVSSDAIEVLSVSFILPSAQCDLGLNSVEKGWLNAVIFVGMMIGGYFWGSMADKFGRRTVLMGSLTVNGLGGLASSTSQVFWLFLLFRFISGVGVGGSIPVIFSYYTEFLPQYRRGAMISALATFWMMGNIIAAGLAWAVIPPDIGFTSGSFKYNSWRIFVSLCTIPSLTSAFMFYFMPESPKFYLTHNRNTDALKSFRKVHNLNRPGQIFKIQKLVLSLDVDEDHDECEGDGEDRAHHDTCCTKLKHNLGHLWKQTKFMFKGPLCSRSVVMVIINFTLSFGYYGLWMWFPQLFARVEENGGSMCNMHAVNSSANSTTDVPHCKPTDWVFFEGFMTALSNLPGNIVTILIMDKVGRKPLLAVSMVVSGVAVFMLPVVHTKAESLAISCVFGAVSTVGWNALDVLQAELYPTTVRATAFGVLSGVGRIAAIAGNLVFGNLLDVHCAIPMILVSALLAIGGLSAIKLPNTLGVDIH